MFEYVYIFSTILQKSILADISKVSLLKGELFWDFLKKQQQQQNLCLEKNTVTKVWVNLF